MVDLFSLLIAYIEKALKFRILNKILLYHILN